MGYIAFAEDHTLADLLVDLGGIAPRRVRCTPAPGKATLRDVVRFNDHSEHLYELVDGTLVEKVMSFSESAIASALITFINVYLMRHDRGFVTGEAGAVRLLPGLVRIPDVSFFSWDQLPSRELPTDRVARLIPRLAVEVLSRGNTRKEMDRKVREYFQAGVRLVWLVDPRTRTVKVYTAPDDFEVLSETESLTGGDVLPGLSVPLSELFARVSRPATKSRNRRPKKRSNEGNDGG